jgi:hypothetical protein
MSDFTLACRESGDEDTTALEMRSATEKFTIGTVEAEYAPRIVACVNFLQRISTTDLALLMERSAYREQAIDEIKWAISGAKGEDIDEWEANEAGCLLPEDAKDEPS